MFRKKYSYWFGNLGYLWMNTCTACLKLKFQTWAIPGLNIRFCTACTQRFTSVCKQTNNVLGGWWASLSIYKLLVRYMKQTILNHLPFFYNGVCLLFTHLWLKQHSSLLKVMEDRDERARWWALNFYGQLLFRHRKGLHGSTLLRSLVPPSSCSASKFSHSRVFF